MLRHRVNDLRIRVTLDIAWWLPKSWNDGCCAVMAAMSAARAGAGLVTLHVPACGYEIAQGLAPNIMVVCDSNEHHLSAVDDFQRYNAVCIGQA
jgi:NAD(P)H-hydrate repair Nnr-like enzyme with NAD(P)H-hydrate dehydratase domain